MKPKQPNYILTFVAVCGNGMPKENWRLNLNLAVCSSGQVVSDCGEAKCQALQGEKYYGHHQNLHLNAASCNTKACLNTTKPVFRDPEPPSLWTYLRKNPPPSFAQSNGTIIRSRGSQSVGCTSMILNSHRSSRRGLNSTYWGEWSCCCGCCRCSSAKQPVTEQPVLL